MSLLLAVSGVGPVNYVLACDTGVYTYTGIAADLKVRHSLVCAAGAYVYTGQAATLKVAHSLVCAAGSYTYTGVAATLKVAHSLVCSPGAYPYTGQAATLSVAHKLICSPGAYNYTGNDAVLTYNKIAAQENSGGWNDYSNHPYFRSVLKKEEKVFIQKQADLEEQVAQVEVEVESNEHIKIDGLEIKLQSLQEELDGIKVLNALIAEQIEKELLEEEEIIFLLLAA